MNIHFKDIELFEKLKNATLHKVVIGSSMYGTNDVNSDVDYLYIYVPSISECNTFYPSHHQLQYKENGIDHNFVNIFTFFKNCLNGDSTINIEVISHDSIKNSYLSFLWDMRFAFYNYKIVRGFSGLCRRDLRELPKYAENEKNKKIAHVLRGHEFCKMIMENRFNPIISDTLKDSIVKIKSLSDWKERKDVCETLKADVEAYRKYISELYDTKNFPLPSFMSVENQIILDKHVNDLIASDIWKEKSNWKMDLKAFYEANENPEINYE